MTDSPHSEHPRFGKVRNWGLWTLPRPALRYVLGFEVLTVAIAVWAVLSEAVPTSADWRRFGAFALAGALHMWLSRRTEETRRDGSAGPHMDTSVVWILPAMVLLPAWMAVAAMLLLRVQLFPVARRPLYRYAFGTSAILVAALACMAVVRAAGVDIASGVEAYEALVLTAAGATYFVVNAVAIGGVLLLSTPRPTWATVIGSHRDNALGALTVCLGVVAALAVAHAWPAPLLLVPVLCALDWGALQIENSRTDARTDHKTLLLNSRGWHEQASIAIARARRQRTPLTAAILDLDHFKAVNDTWGHPAGDAVLREVGRVLRTTTRAGDVVGRFGGEEFVLLLPDTTAEDAAVVAERIRRGVAEMAVTATDKRGQPVVITGRTTSIGLASAAGDVADLDVLLQYADAAVYDAKNGGRDQVRVAAWSW